MAIYDYAWFFLCIAGTDIIGDNRIKIIHGRKKAEKNFRLGNNLCVLKHLVSVFYAEPIL